MQLRLFNGTTGHFILIIPFLAGRHESERHFIQVAPFHFWDNGSDIWIGRIKQSTDVQAMIIFRKFKGSASPA